MVPLAVLTALACAAVASAVPAGFVQAQGSAFVVDGITKRFAGTNNYYLIYAPRSMVDDVLTRAARQGLGYIRLWAFLDVGNTDGGWSIDGSGLKNGVYFRCVVCGRGFG
jgi:mannan endo-1,4-beta-mannosidase